MLQARAPIKARTFFFCFNYYYYILYIHMNIYIRLPEYIWCSWYIYIYVFRAEHLVLDSQLGGSFLGRINFPPSYLSLNACSSSSRVGPRETCPSMLTYHLMLSSLRSYLVLSAALLLRFHGYNFALLYRKYSLSADIL